MFEASIGKAQHHENLTLFPVLAETGRDLPYLLMADALASGTLTISEKGDGVVPVLLAKNSAPHPVLILDGEQLVGARQNRMTNRSILLAAMSTVEIPVACMEHGRWHFVSDAFAPAPQYSPSKIRRKARETEVRALHEAAARGLGERSSHRDLQMAQGEIWQEIREMGDNLGGASLTGALDALYTHRRDDMHRWIEAFPLLPLQVGLVAFMGTTPLGVDAVGSPDLFAKLHRRLLTGYVLDAMDGLEPEARDREHGHPAPDAGHRDPNPGSRPETPGPGKPRRRRARTAAALQFMEAVRQAARTPSESVGLGEYRVLHGAVLGGELVNEGLMVHVSAFPSRGNGSQAGWSDPVREAGPIARPSQRRRRY